MNNIYILTEEKPKISVIKQLFDIYKNDFNGNYIIDENITIRPAFEDDKFLFYYEVCGIIAFGIDKIYIKTVSGSSSFLDFLFFVSNHEPNQDLSDKPLFAVEETKTSDDESRNTGVYQRCSKFVFIKAYYSDVPAYMLYNEELELRESKKPSDTSIFGTNMLLTNGVKIVGKPVEKWFKAFNSIDEMIEFKNKMKRPPKSNTPILISKNRNTIYVSGRLDKPQNEGKIAHDPNIGCLSIISATLRKLGWNGDIVITKHAVEQKYINHTKGKNKFLYICKLLDIKLDNIEMPTEYHIPEEYWHYEKSSEKIASILFHIQTENFGFKEVYQNHAGCERGYFKDKSGRLITLPKKTPTGANLLIPDVIMRDDLNKIIYLIEGKKLSTINAGLEEIEDYDDIEELYIKTNYTGYDIKRYLSIFGGSLNELPHSKVLIYVNDKGDVIVNSCEPKIKDMFKEPVYLN